MWHQLASGVGLRRRELPAGRLSGSVGLANKGVSEPKTVSGVFRNLLPNSEIVDEGPRLCRETLGEILLFRLIFFPMALPADSESDWSSVCRQEQNRLSAEENC